MGPGAGHGKKSGKRNRWEGRHRKILSGKGIRKRDGSSLDRGDAAEKGSSPPVAPLKAGEF